MKDGLGQVIGVGLVVGLDDACRPWGVEFPVRVGLSSEGSVAVVT